VGKLEKTLAGLEDGTTCNFVGIDTREALQQLRNISRQIEIDNNNLGATSYEQFCPQLLFSILISLIFFLSLAG
jgi:hypothetical protein